MERTRRLTTFGVGSCAALALLAGTAVGQMMHDDGMQRHDAMQKQSGMHMQQGDWKSAHQLPTRSDVILAGKTHDGRNVNVIFTQGRLESAELDQNRINPRQVQMKGDLHAAVAACLGGHDRAEAVRERPLRGSELRLAAFRHQAALR